MRLTVPLLFSVRVARAGSPDRVEVPLALVTPVPLIVPPVQVSAPVTVTVSGPVNVPVNVSEGRVSVEPVANVVVPPFLYTSSSVLQRTPVSYPLPVVAYQARKIAASFGYSRAPLDSWLLPH